MYWFQSSTHTKAPYRSQFVVYMTDRNDFFPNRKQTHQPAIPGSQADQEEWTHKLQMQMQTYK